MGKIISVWSSSRKTGKTVFLYNLITNIQRKADMDISILAACINFKYGNLLSLFGINQSELNLEDIVNIKIHPYDDFDIMKALAKKDNMYFLGSRKTDSSYANRNMKIFESVVTELKNNFDLVFFDCISGDENSLTNMVLDKSDYVLNIIGQDKEILDTNRFITNKDIACIVNKYKNIYPNSSDLKALYSLDNLFILPDCDTLQEIKNKGKLAYYNELDTDYNKALDEISGFICRKLKIEFKNQTSVIHPKGIFSIFTKGGKAK